MTDSAGSSADFQSSGTGSNGPKRHNPANAAGSDIVVVLNYHGHDDTLACVESLIIGSPSVRVLVVDNGSFDGTLEDVSRRWPTVCTLQTGTNLGFAGGMNRGIDWALHRNARTVTVLNNDTIVPPGVISELAGVALENYVVSPEVRYADGSERVWFGGGTVDEPTCLARHLSDAELADLDGETRPFVRYSDILAGCCITATAEAWTQVGLFDERYFLNFEDSDWSLRARAKGLTLGVVPSLVIYHKVSASFTGAYSYLGMLYYARNGLLFGSTVHPRDPVTRWRFLRRHVLPVLAGDIRRREWSEMARHGVIVGIAVGSHILGLYGRAPRSMEALTTRWSASAGSRPKPR